MSNSARAVVVAGPTASGKSDLALDFGRVLGGEIVNCDSVQLYRYMDIGSAKTPPDDRRGIPHHLIDILNPDEVFTAGDYIGRAGRPCVKLLREAGYRLSPEGPGFYLRALLDGLFEGPARDEDLRARLKRRKPGILHRLFKRFDPDAAQPHPSNDTQKLIRALEVCILARAPITSLHRHSRVPLEGFEVVKIGLDPPREQLTDRITPPLPAHVRHRIGGETIDSRAASRRSKALNPSDTAKPSAPYPENPDEALPGTQIATRQYAKRQRTWFDASLG